MVQSIATLEKFVASWRVLSDKYKQDAPGLFGTLPNYSELIEQPLMIGQQALSELKEGHVKVAHSTFEDIRNLLWKMRTEAGLVTLSDKINDFHEVMEVVLDKMHEDESVESFNAIAKRYGPWLEIKWEELANVDVIAAEHGTFDKALIDGRNAIADLRKVMAGDDVKAAKGASKVVKKAYKAVFFLDSAS